MPCARNYEMRRQRALALVELLVALALGGFLVLGITQLFLDGKRHYGVQQGQLANQENARLAIQLISRLVAQAGYRTRPEQDSPEAAFGAMPASGGCPAFASGQSIALALAGDGRRAELCVRYQRGFEAQEADCTGNPLAFSAQPLNVVARLSFDSLAGELGCASRVESAVGFASSSVLVDGLLDFQFQPLPRPRDPLQAIGIALLFASEQHAADGIASERLEHWRALSGRRLELPAGDSRLLHVSQLSLALRSIGP